MRRPLERGHSTICPPKSNPRRHQGPKKEGGVVSQAVAPFLVAGFAWRWGRMGVSRVRAVSCQHQPRLSDNTRFLGFGCRLQLPRVCRSIGTRYISARSWYAPTHAHMAPCWAQRHVIYPPLAAGCQRGQGPKRARVADHLRGFADDGALFACRLSLPWVVKQTTSKRFLEYIYITMSRALAVVNGSSGQYQATPRIDSSDRS